MRRMNLTVQGKHVVDSVNQGNLKNSKFTQTDSFKCTCLIIGIILIWTILAFASTILVKDTEQPGLSALATYLKSAGQNGSIMLFFAAMASVLILVKNSGELSTFQYINKHIKDIPRIAGKAGFNAVLGVVTFAVFTFAYSTIKTRIPAVIPYSWDETFLKMDRVLFLGQDPWVLFKWLYDMPSVINFMDRVYDIWAGILIGAWALCFISYKYEIKTRFRFPLALLITWFIGGNVLALLFSSAGPCYYGLVTGLSDPYAAQLSTLRALDADLVLSAVRYQDLLWGVYNGPGFGLGGISAMPSMHCATSALLVLFAWKRPILKWLALAFFCFIFISSIVLAWHYAVDGLVAIPIALGAWWLSGKILTRIAKTT